MKLKDVEINNFRGINSLVLSLDQLTVLVGENNTGKSTVLEAIRLVLSRSAGNQRNRLFSEYDFHLVDASATPQTSEPIQITLHFAEENQDEWPEAIVQQLADVVQFDSAEYGVNHIWLRVSGIFNADIGSFDSMWTFLDFNKNELSLNNSTPFALVPRFSPLFFLSALRDASQEFGQRGQFWKSFLKTIQIPDEERNQIEETLKDINLSVIDASDALRVVTQKIASARKLVPLDSDQPVVLEALPTRIFDMVGKIQVHLKSAYGAKLPLKRHGEGTQSLAVLMLFQAFVDNNLAEAYTPESIPILALEEPEAHLHPSAICSLGSSLQNFPGQTLISSHSGDLISRVPITSLRRLYKVDGETKIGQVESNLFSSRQIQALNYSICLTKGQYLFSRCWLLVEGESDFHLMPMLLDLMGYSQDLISLSVIEISQAFEKGEPFIKLAKALGIQWFMMADGDPEGNNYVHRAGNHLENGEVLANRARTLTRADIEHEFWFNGYNAFIEKMVTTTRKNQIHAEAAEDVDKKIKLMIKAAIKHQGGKPAFAQALMSEVTQRGVNTIPQIIQEVITHVVQLAQG